MNGFNETKGINTCGKVVIEKKKKKKKKKKKVLI